MVEHYTATVARQPGDAGSKRRLARSCYYLFLSASSATDRAPSAAVGIQDSLDVARRGAGLYDDLYRADPTNGALALEAAQLCWATAAFLLKQQDYKEVGRWCDHGVSFLDRRLLGTDKEEGARSICRDLFIFRANVRIKEERHLEALRDLEAAFQYDPAARTRPFVAEVYATTVAKARLRLVVGLLRRGQHAEAVDYADALVKLPNIPGEALYDGACACGVAAGAANEPPLREKYAARSVELLRMAFAAGFGKDPIQKASGIFGDPVQHMEHDPDLVAVRGREDYRKLLAELKRKP